MKIRFSYTIELPPTQSKDCVFLTWKNNFDENFLGEASTGFILPPEQAPGVCDETYIGMKVFLNGVKNEVKTTLNGWLLY